MPTKYCEAEGCTTQANYGDPETRRYQFCAKCKPAHHVCLKNAYRRMCEGCGIKRPVFGPFLMLKPTHCSGCADRDTMDDKITKMCTECDRRAHFTSVSDPKVRLWCSEHAKIQNPPGLPYRYKSNICATEGCNKYAQLIQNVGRIWCKGCWRGPDGLKKQCEHEECSEIATHGDPETRRLQYCEHHGEMLGLRYVRQNKRKSSDVIEAAGAFVKQRRIQIIDDDEEEPPPVVEIEPEPEEPEPEEPEPEEPEPEPNLERKLKLEQTIKKLDELRDLLSYELSIL